MATTLQFTDGTTTIDLTYATSDYKMLHDQWSPRVADKYEPVVEEIGIAVYGSSTVDVFSNFHTLKDLFEQSNRWHNGEIVDAVQLQYKHNDSSTTVSSVIWDASVIPPREFTSVSHGRGYQLGHRDDPVILRFTRQPRWLSSSETETSSVSTGNPAILTTSTFTNALKTLCPYDAKLDFTISAAGEEPMLGSRIFCCFTNSADKLQIEEGEDADSTDGTGWVLPLGTTVTGASAGEVARFSGTATPVTITWNASQFSSFNSDIRKFYIIAMLRNSSTGIPATTWWSLNASYENIASRKHVVEYAANYPEIVVYGPIVIPQALSNYALTLNITHASGTLTFEIDYFAVIGADDNLRVVEITNYLSNTSEGYRTTILHRLDERLDPEVYTDDSGSGSKRHPAYSGVARLEAAGNAISCLVMGHDPGATGPEFVIESITGEVDIQLTVDRLDAYLAPV